jgi:hypothetical protein
VPCAKRPTLRNDRGAPSVVIPVFTTDIRCRNNIPYDDDALLLLAAT